jgi:hypothetical protein
MITDIYKYDFILGIKPLSITDHSALLLNISTPINDNKKIKIKRYDHKLIKNDFFSYVANFNLSEIFFNDFVHDVLNIYEKNSKIIEVKMRYAENQKWMTSEIKKEIKIKRI